MKRFALVVALLLLAQSAAAQILPDAEIRKILADRVDTQKKAVGIVVGVIEPSVRRVVAYGALDANDKRPLNGDTLFEIGSATKVFTSLLLADMVQRGEVALSDPIAKFLPSDVKVPKRGEKQITLLDLATHTSGLPRLPSNLNPKDPANPYADYTVAQMYEFLRSYELKRDIGETYEYSNFGAGLLGHVLALRAKSDYETLVRTRITAPLAMKSTAIKLTNAMKSRLAVGHNEELKSVPNWDLPTLAGAGALRSTANDLLTFLAANLGVTKSPLGVAMKSMLATRRPTGAPNLEIALGWHITTANDRQIVWHNGGTYGYRSYIGFDPKNRTGVVVLANTFTNAGIDDIGQHLLNSAAPLLAAAKERKAIELDGKVLEGLVGRYALSPDFAITVTRDGSHLFIQATGQAKFEAYPENATKFFLKVVDAQITF
ncbi:MAG TPA: serine hydrolase, partial [Thermoanaerobaculia bacterium]|nr:serine hydrolase [Thermoanaerobaculia bacterium]